jgi:hypothetical protein
MSTLEVIKPWYVVDVYRESVSGTGTSKKLEIQDKIIYSNSSRQMQSLRHDPGSQLLSTRRVIQGLRTAKVSRVVIGLRNKRSIRAIRRDSTKRCGV